MESFGKFSGKWEGSIVKERAVRYEKHFVKMIGSAMRVQWMRDRIKPCSEMTHTVSLKSHCQDRRSLKRRKEKV